MNDSLSSVRVLARVLLTMATIALLFGCTSPFTPSSGNGPLDRSGSGSDSGLTDGGEQSGTGSEELGSLRINNVNPGGDGIRIATVFPGVAASDITHYRITVGSGPAGSSPQEQTVTSDGSGGLSSPVVFTDLVPGEWTVTVSGFDGEPGSGGTEMVSGSNTVTISAGAVQSLDVPVALLSDASTTGSWSLRLEWPAQSSPDYATTDVVSAVEYTTDGGTTWQTAGTEADATILTDGGDTRYVEIAGTRSPGSFFLTVRLAADKPAPYDIVARYDEMWHVFGNTTTQNTVALTESDFSYGGGTSVSVSLDLPADLSSFFSGTPASTVAAGSDFSITADVAGAAAYQWRVDGQEQAGATSESFTLSTSTDEVGIVKTITLSVTVDGTTYSGTHRVRVVSP